MRPQNALRLLVPHSVQQLGGVRQVGEEQRHRRAGHARSYTHGRRDGKQDAPDSESPPHVMALRAATVPGGNIERYDVTANVPPSSQKEDGHGIDPE